MFSWRFTSLAWQGEHNQFRCLVCEVVHLTLQTIVLRLPHWTEKIPYINRLMIQMKWVGYSENSKQIAATRALAKMDGDVHDFNHIGRPLFRSKGGKEPVYQEDKI